MLGSFRLQELDDGLYMFFARAPRCQHLFRRIYPSLNHNHTKFYNTQSFLLLLPSPSVLTAIASLLAYQLHPSPLLEHLYLHPNGPSSQHPHLHPT